MTPGWSQQSLVQEGAYNYSDKPFPLDAAKYGRKSHRIDRFRNQAEFLLSEGLNRLPRQFKRNTEKIRDNIMKIAQHQNVTVLLRGESGTGKEVAARMIHHASGCKGDFVALIMLGDP